MAEAPVIVFASFIPKAGKDRELERVLRGMTAPTRQEAGCEIYDLYKTAETPTSFHLFERYKSRAALDAHRAAEYYKAYRAAVPELLAEPIKVFVLEGLDVRT